MSNVTMTKSYANGAHFSGEQCASCPELRYLTGALHLSMQSPPNLFGNVFTVESLINTDVMALNYHQPYGPEQCKGPDQDLKIQALLYLLF